MEENVTWHFLCPKFNDIKDFLLKDAESVEILMNADNKESKVFCTHLLQIIEHVGYQRQGDG
jgi:hypothetical protein